jgi:hypothetical protein
VQGSTLTDAVIDLKHDPSARGQDAHKKYCSNYVQLSRLRSLEGLHLLQSITMEDLQCGDPLHALFQMDGMDGNGGLCIHFHPFHLPDVKASIHPFQLCVEWMDGWDRRLGVRV